MNKGTKLDVVGTVSDGYDIPKGAGYGTTSQLTIEGTPGEKVVMDGVWKSIEEAGDLPVYVRVTLTWAGHEWPWTKVVSKYDIEYQAVHMAEGTFLGALAAWTLLNLATVGAFIWVLLKVAVVAFVLLKVSQVVQWLIDQDLGPAVGVGLGAGAVILAGLILLGGDKK